MEPLTRPGFGMPLNHKPSSRSKFPTIQEDGWRASTLTIRELFMLWFTEQITNKPKWEIKVFDNEIVRKWRTEVDHVDWLRAVGYTHGPPISDAVWDHVSLLIVRR
jgi:hypothetical protein